MPTVTLSEKQARTLDEIKASTDPLLLSYTLAASDALVLDGDMIAKFARFAKDAKKRYKGNKTVLKAVAEIESVVREGSQATEVFRKQIVGSMKGIIEERDLKNLKKLPSRR